MSCSGCEQTILSALNALSGVHETRADHRTGRVKITYDLHTVRIQTLEEKLAELGYPPGNGFWARRKRDWIHFTEQNKRDNLTHQGEGHCCSKPPGA